MTSLRLPSDDELARARALRDGIFVFQPEPPAQQEPVPIEFEVIVRNTFHATLSLGFEIDGEFAGEENDVLRGESVSLGTLATIAGARTLGIRMRTPASFFHFDGPATITAGAPRLLIDCWNALYPPNVLLGETWLNPPPGIRYRSTGEPRCPTPGDYPLFLIDRDVTLYELGRAPRNPAALLQELDLWIDGIRVVGFDRTVLNFTTPVLHRALLSPGIHTVRIGDPRRRELILDTDIVIDSINPVEIDIANRTSVAVREGNTVVFQQDARERPFGQGNVLLDVRGDPRREIDGIPIPPGAENYIEEIEKERQFNLAMAANFRDFRDKKKAVNAKKARGEPLSTEEQMIDAIDTYEKLDAWIRQKKKAERGWDLATAGTTSPDGEMKYHGPPPTNPLKELIKRETLGIHEPSHALDVDVLALKFGVDLDKLRRYREFARKRREAIEKAIAELEKAKEGEPLLLPDITNTPEEDALERWYEDNKEKIERYYEAYGDPLAGAEGEIREYTAGAEFYEAVLKYLQREGFGLIVPGMGLNVPVDQTKEILIGQLPAIPPRVEVIEGTGVVEVSAPELVRRVRGGSGLYKVKIKGKDNGKARIAVICGNLRKVLVVNVV
jgi:hypothetical protein